MNSRLRKAARRSDIQTDGLDLTDFLVRSGRCIHIRGLRIYRVSGYALVLVMALGVIIGASTYSLPASSHAVPRNTLPSVNVSPARPVPVERKLATPVSVPTSSPEPCANALRAERIDDTDRTLLDGMVGQLSQDAASAQTAAQDSPEASVAAQAVLNKDRDALDNILADMASEQLTLEAAFRTCHQ